MGWWLLKTGHPSSQVTGTKKVSRPIKYQTRERTLSCYLKGGLTYRVVRTTPGFSSPTVPPTNSHLLLELYLHVQCFVQGAH